MIAVLDDDLQRAANAGELTGTGVGDDGDEQLLAAGGADAAVHEGEAAVLALQRAGHALDGHVGAGAGDAAPCGEHLAAADRLEIVSGTPPWVQQELRRMGYKVETVEKNSGPINAILVDQAHGTLWGGSSDYGEDYGIGW